MLRAALSIIAASALVGCAAARQPEAVAPIVEEVEPQPATAMALVFDPPVVLDEPPVDLAREPRERAAFVAFEDQAVTFYYIHIDDRQVSDGGGRNWRHGGGGLGRYERRALIDKFGATYR
jgi:hypothetical protein